jgi:TetR/AcrR family transcriptional regulator of autoinduction and epiphytic fitness
VITNDENEDGRTARGRRTREAVIDALLSLLEEGNLQPSARQIADRGGVALRSVWTHFSDKESLYAEAGEREVARLRAVKEEIDPGLPLPERITRFAEQRARILEKLSPVAEAARLREPFSPQLRASRDAYYALARANVEQVFGAELARYGESAGRDLTDQLLVVSSWSTWRTMRQELGIGYRRACELMADTLRALFRP